MRHAGLFPSLVPAIAALALAGCIETAVVGGAAVGSTALQDRGIKGAAADLGIRSEINDLWFKDEHGQIFMRDLNLQVQEGRVLVSGEVANADLRARAVQLAWKASGVREVLNEIQVAERGGIAANFADARITSTLRVQLMGDRNVRDINYSIDTVNGVVYLMGIAQDQAEMDRVVGYARNISGVKQVVNHAVLRDDPRRR